MLKSALGLQNKPGILMEVESIKDILIRSNF